MKKGQVSVKRSLQALLVCCAVHISSHASLAQERIESLAARIQPSIVAILTYGDDGAIMQQDSGFFVSKTGDVLTSFRILKGAKRIVIKMSDGKIHKVAKFVAADSKSGLFRLSVDSPDTETQPLQFCVQIPKVGEQVAIIGPQGAGIPIQTGTVVEIEQASGYDRVIRIGADLAVGLGGAPVVNMKGEVIGAAAPTDKKGKAVSLAILSNLVINVSSDVGPVFGVRTPETPAYDSRVVTLEADVVQGAPIKRVQPKPPAIRVPGTVVVEITVDEQGAVISARAASGHPLLRPAAVSAAREWKFSPTTAAGIPIKVIGSLSFNFQ